MNAVFRAAHAVPLKPVVHFQPPIALKKRRSDKQRSSGQYHDLGLFSSPQLAEKNEELRNAVNKARKESGAVDQFLRVVRETTCPDVLTPELVGNLIDRVEVGETYMEGDVKKQDIRILFNFIGEVD